MFEQLLSTMYGIYFDAPDDSGGGGMSPEEYTNQKLGGNEPSPTPKPKGDEGGEPKPEPETPPEPTKKPNEDGPEPKAKPEPKKEGEGGGTDDGEGATSGKSKDGGEGGEEDSEFYFDPEKHVEGKPAHSNKFKTREQAEYAAIAKADLLKNKLDEMKEDGVSPGAIPLPKALQNNLESIDQFTSLEVVNAMDDDELRSFLNESDATRQRFEEKHNRVKTEKKVREAKSRYEEVQVELYDDLEKIMDRDTIKSNIDKLGKKETAKEFIETSIQDKIKSELAPMRDDLNEWIEQVDAGEINLSIKEFDKQKQQKVDAINRKAKELRDEYSGAIEKVDELYTLHEEVGEAQKDSPEVIRQNMFSAFDEFQKDRSGIMPILDDNPTAKAELVAAKKFAIQNKEQFNNLQNPNDWVQALEVGWEQHKSKIRAEQQKKTLNGEKPKGDSENNDRDDVPKPGDQDKLKTNFTTDSVHSSNKRSLDKIVELTNSKI